MPASLNATLRNARADAITTFAGNGSKLRIYTAGGSLLVELPCGSPLAAAAVSGTLTLSVSSAAASASGTASVAKLFKADGTLVIDGLAVGQAVVLNSTDIQAGDIVTVTSATITEGNA